MAHCQGLSTQDIQWSPSGSFLACRLATLGKNGFGMDREDEAGIAVLKHDGLQPVCNIWGKLFPHIEILEWAWSPDEQLIAIIQMAKNYLIAEVRSLLSHFAYQGLGSCAWLTSMVGSARSQPIQMQSCNMLHRPASALPVIQSTPSHCFQCKNH